jgi:hypothetical protein
MKKSCKLISVIALAAVIGFVFAACGGGDPLNGTWKSGEGEIIKFNKGSFEISQNNKPGMRGAYTVGAKSAGSITMVVQALHGDVLNKHQDAVAFDDNKWYNKNQVLDAFRKWIREENSSITDDQISAALGEMSDSFNDIFSTYTGTIDGDTIIVDGTAYTRDTGGENNKLSVSGETGGDPFSGAWETGGEVIKLNKGSLEIAQNNKPRMRGTYTADAKSAGNVTMVVQELNGGFLNKSQKEVTFDEDEWYNKSQVVDAFREWIHEEKPSLTDDQIADTLDELSGNFDVLFPTYAGTIKGKAMIVDGTAYTKSGGGENKSAIGENKPGISVSGSGGGTFTLTDIPAQYNGKYARFTAAGNIILTGAQSIDAKDVTLPRIANGRVSIPMWIIRNAASFVRYTGSDTFTAGAVNLYNSGSDTVNAASKEIVNIAFMNITFSNGNAVKSWKEALMVVAP